MAEYFFNFSSWYITIFVMNKIFERRSLLQRSISWRCKMSFYLGKIRILISFLEPVIRMSPDDLTFNPHFSQIKFCSIWMMDRIGSTEIYLIWEKCGKMVRSSWLILITGSKIFANQWFIIHVLTSICNHLCCNFFISILKYWFWWFLYKFQFLAISLYTALMNSVHWYQLFLYISIFLKFARLMV